MTDGDHNQKQLKVVGLCGSLREGSYTRQALAIALQGAAELHAKIELIDLTDYALVFCDGKDDQSRYAASGFPPDVLRLRAQVAAAQGVILGTPEYHGSYSGVLKNAIDLMGFDEFEGKMIGLVGVSGGAMGAISALQSLRDVSRALHAWVIPHQAAISEAWKQFDDEGKMRDEKLRERVLAVGRQVAQFAMLHNSCARNAFLEAWQQSHPNPGGG